MFLSTFQLQSVPMCILVTEGLSLPSSLSPGGRQLLYRLLSALAKCVASELMVKP